MEQGSDFVGTVDDLAQDSDAPILPLAAVRVSVDGPVETHEVPSVSGGCRSFPLVAADGPKRVANGDPRRRVLRIISDQAFFVGENANEVQSRYAARWPANVTCVLTHMEEVYVGILVDGTVSVIAENWAS